MTLFLVLVSKGSVDVLKLLSQIDVCFFYILGMFLNYDSQRHDVLAYTIEA